jgi:hypothetical protein
MILHTLNYTTLDISNQPLNLDNFKIIGKFKIIQSDSGSGSISGHMSEGFQIPFLFENYDSFQIIHYPERYYFRIKDNSNNWTSWQRHKHKIADIDGLQTILDSFNSRISALESNSIGLPPGVILSVAWNPNFYVGKRVIPLNGQGIPINDDYAGLVNATYVGDSLNETAHFFYKYNSSTNGRDTNGDYFRLPDTKALVPKGRYSGTGGGYFGSNVKYNSDIIGNVVEDAVQNHQHWRFSDQSEEETLWRRNTSVWGHVNWSVFSYYFVWITGYMYNGRATSHTRDSSFAVDFVITY